MVLVLHLPCVAEDVEGTVPDQKRERPQKGNATVRGHAREWPVALEVPISDRLRNARYPLKG